MKLTMLIKARPLKILELYQTLQALLPTIRKQPGCEECRIFRDTENEDIFSLSMIWDEQISLERYLRSNNGSALLGAIDILAENTKLKIGVDEPWEGIEVLKRMRKNS